MMASLPYSVAMACALTLAYLLSRRAQMSLPLTSRQRAGIGLGAFCGGMIGAKLPMALASSAGLVSFSAWFSHGKTILGGLVGGYAGVEIAKRLLGTSVKTGDSFAAPVAVAVGVGRVSCFIGGCCFGAPTSLPWALDFGDGVPRHPTQLYEMIFHLSLAAFLYWALARGLWKGQLFKLYVMAYLLYRFLTEFIRPEPRLLGSWTAYQGACLLLLPVFGYLWLRDAEAA